MKSQSRRYWPAVGALALALAGCEAPSNNELPPDPCDGQTCSGHGLCRAPQGTPFCVCEENYVVNGLACELEACSGWQCGHGTCVADDSGSARCVCDEGYSGNGCESCQSGYHLEGAVCVVNIECPTNPCEHGECHMEGPASVCVCETGYAQPTCAECMDGYEEGATGCVRVDPCDPSPCNHGTCEAAGGEPQCTCATGYALPYCTACTNGYHESTTGECVPNNPCDPSPCDHGTCAVVAGNAQCTCNTGYKLPTCTDCADDYVKEGALCVAKPSDPCLADPCDETPHRTICVPNGNTRTCECEFGYVDGAAGACDAVPLCTGTCNWTARSCDVTLTYTLKSGETAVKVAGAFTSWGTSPRAMTCSGNDCALTLSPEAGKLVSGQRYAYKLIVNTSTWILDPKEVERKYDGDCINSAFTMPACASGPEVKVDPVQTTYNAATSAGTAQIHVVIKTASGVANNAPKSVALQLDHKPMSASAITVDGPNGAIDVALSGLSKGRHTLKIEVTDEGERASEPVYVPFWIEAEPFDWRDAFMYMILVDRFADGDKTTNGPLEGMRDNLGNPITGVGVDGPASFHGGDLWGAYEVMKSGYFDDLGVRVIWLSPINQQTPYGYKGQDPNDPHYYSGYHGYWPTRSRTVEPRFGGNAALKAFVDEAHRHGIRVLFDLINNQIHREHEYCNAAAGSVECSATNGHPAWFRTGGVCGIDPGWGWSEKPLDCMFAKYLPDINWRNTDGEDQFVSDGLFWLQELDIDGYRVDAVKHVETNSIFNLRSHIQRAFQGGTRIYMVGETAVGEGDDFDSSSPQHACVLTAADGYAWVDLYTGANALDGQFDFPTHHNTRWNLLTDSAGYDQIETQFHKAETRYKATDINVKFLGTHDSNRMVTIAAQDARRNCRWVGLQACENGVCNDCASLATEVTDGAVFDRLKRAWTVLLTQPGIPFLYQGDEIAMWGGNDPDQRKDMFWDGDLASLKMGSETSITQQRRDLRTYVAALGKARQASKALRRGTRTTLVAEATFWVYGYNGPSASDVAVVVINRGGAINSRSVPFAGSFSIPSGTALSAKAGSGTVTVGSGLTVSIGAGQAAVFAP